MVVKARVVHSHISTVGSDRVTYRTGIEFVDLSEPVMQGASPVSSKRSTASGSASRRGD